MILDNNHKLAIFLISLPLLNCLRLSSTLSTAQTYYMPKLYTPCINGTFVEGLSNSSSPTPMASISGWDFLDVVLLADHG